MDRWTWMMARALSPAFVALAAGLGLTWLLRALASSQYFAAIAPLANWTVLATAAFVIGHFGWVCCRLWRAEHGKGLLCECGGLLGRERDGRYGPYRKCLACSNNVARRSYDQ